ncbi:MAG: hypothetical protein MJ158_03075 [Alphaproteobacteria bacterium]|nr:hypothetical protein [Alphaproteobacteria bacterium]
MDCNSTTCNLFKKEVAKSAFNLSCHCAGCIRPSSECASCKEYDKRIVMTEPTTKQKKAMTNCFYCLNCNSGR